MKLQLASLALLVGIVTERCARGEWRLHDTGWPSERARAAACTFPAGAPGSTDAIVAIRASEMQSRVRPPVTSSVFPAPPLGNSNASMQRAGPGSVRVRPVAAAEGEPPGRPAR